MPNMWVGGEVMNFTRAASGHWYFVLRDDRAQADCVMMARFAALAKTPAQRRPGGGSSGRPTIYAPRGALSVGGAIHSHVRRRTAAPGFHGKKKSAGRARMVHPRPQAPAPILAEPARSRLLAAGRGCARCFLKSPAARMPGIPIVIYPAPAQGEDAAARIAQALRTAGQRGECDALIVCRGGGGMEELWAYNEEEVVAAIVESPVPVVSGIGHETDETLADYAADLRAATPTAAASAAVPGPGGTAARGGFARPSSTQGGPTGGWGRKWAQRLDFLRRGDCRARKRRDWKRRGG